MKHLYTLCLFALLLPTLTRAQTTLAPGDLVFVGFNISDDGGFGPTNPPGPTNTPITPGSIQDDQFQFMLLRNVAAGTKIYFTDYGWKTSGGFAPSWTAGPQNNGSGTGATTDGIISWTASSSVAAGTVIRVTCKYTLTTSLGAVASEEKVTPFNTSPAGTGSMFMELGAVGQGLQVAPVSYENGDELFAYQATSARAANPTLVAGIRFVGEWGPMTGTEFSATHSDVPTSLTANGLNAAPELNNFQWIYAAKYDCSVQANITTGFPKALRNAVNTKAKWTIPNANDPTCPGFFYDPTTANGCLQISLAGFLPSTCTFTVLNIQITGQPVSKVVCADQTATFSVTATNATNYQWQSSPNGSAWTSVSNGAVYSGATSATLTVLNPTGLNGTFYRVIASETTEPASATSNGAATLTVNPVPTVTLTTPNICAPASATLTATSGLVSYTYIGSNGFSSTGTTNTTAVSGLTAGTYSFTVIAVNASGCRATATSSMTVSSPPTMLLSSANVCVGNAVSLSATSGFSSYTYTGSNGFASTGTTNTTTVSGLTTGPYTFSVVAQDAAGCRSAVASTGVTVNPVPTATLTASPSTTLTCAQNSLTLTATGGTSYTFSAPGAGIVSQDPIAGTAVVNATTIYTVTVGNASGCTSQTTINITGNITPPIAQVLPSSVDLTCQTPVVSLTANGTGTYQWSNGATTQVISVSTAGPYSVTVTGANGCTATASGNVGTNVTPPGATLITSGPLTCAVSSVTLTATSTTGQTFAFSPGVTGIGSTGPTSRTALVTAAGPYSVTVTGANGCTSTASATVNLNTTTPVASLTASSLTFCANSTLTLVAGTGTTYAFSPGATQLGGSSGNTATVSTSGVYSVTVTGANGCTATASLSVSTVAVTTITNTLPATLSACEGTAPSGLTITATGANLTYQWFKGTTALPGQMSSVLTFPPAVPADAGSYYVVVSGACGTVSSNTLVLTVRTRPAAPALAPTSRTAVAAPAATIPLPPFVVATGTLSFSGANGLLNPPNADISVVGVFSFSVTQTDGFGCVSPATPFSLTVLSPLPPASQTLCRGNQVVMNVFSTGARYEWYKNGQTAANKLIDVVGVQRGTTTASLTLVSVQTNGTYYCKVFAANGTFAWFGPFAVVLGNCPNGRVGQPEESQPLMITLAPNPLENNQLQAIISGAEGQPLSVQLVDMQGHTVRQQAWEHTAHKQSVSWEVSALVPGVYLLQATSKEQYQRVKVIKP